MVLAYLLFICCLVGEEASLSSVGGASDCRRNQQNRIVCFAKLESSVCLVLNRSFWLLSDSCGNTFGDSVGESTTSSMSSIKVGNSSTNGSNLNKNNIIKPTFNTLTEEGRKTFEAYHTDLEELFLSRYEMTWQGAILKDTAPIIICKAEVWPNPPLSLNNIQSMINFALERQAKSTDEFDDSNINYSSSSSCVVSFAESNPQTSGTMMGGATMPNPSVQPMNYFHSRTTIEGSTPTFGVP
jgi:hypothetical protein